MKPANTETETTAAGQIYAAVASTVVLTVLLCGLYPAFVWGVSQAVFPNQANGSLVKHDGASTTNVADAVGSRWIGQQFAGDKYFHPRPSAAGAGYDGTASGGTNLGPLSDKFLNGVHGSKNDDGTANPAADFDGVKDLAAAYRKENGMAADAVVPADAVTRSSSGLDPHITPANAERQAARVAKARGMSEEDVRKLIANATDKPSLGLLGDPAVNVLTLNLALDAGTVK